MAQDKRVLPPECQDCPDRDSCEDISQERVDEINAKMDSLYAKVTLTAIDLFPEHPTNESIYNILVAMLERVAMETLSSIGVLSNDLPTTLN